jgi:hypothetical protein
MCLNLILIHGAAGRINKQRKDNYLLKNIKIILEDKGPFVFIEWHQMFISKTDVGQQGLLLVSSGHWGYTLPRNRFWDVFL